MSNTPMLIDGAMNMIKCTGRLAPPLSDEWPDNSEVTGHTRDHLGSGTLWTQSPLEKGNVSCLEIYPIPSNYHHTVGHDHHH